MLRDKSRVPVDLQNGYNMLLAWTDRLRGKFDELVACWARWPDYDIKSHLISIRIRHTLGYLADLIEAD